MSPIEIFLVAVGLALDAFAVSVGAGAAGFLKHRRPVFRLAFHFGLFQAFMPLLGWYLGRGLVAWVAAIDHWIAFGLLVIIGLRMIRSGFDSDQRFTRDPSRGYSLILLSLATSIDALAVGLSLAMLEIEIALPCVVIGVVTCALAILGGILGDRLRAVLGKRMEIVGGLILIGIGLRILIEQLSR